jgi:hypothetical protein
MVKVNDIVAYRRSGRVSFRRRRRIQSSSAPFSHIRELRSHGGEIDVMGKVLAIFAGGKVRYGQIGLD